MFHGFDLKNNYNLYIIPNNGEESTLEGIDIERQRLHILTIIFLEWHMRFGAIYVNCQLKSFCLYFFFLTLQKAFTDYINEVSDANL